MTYDEAKTALKDWMKNSGELLHQSRKEVLWWARTGIVELNGTFTLRELEALLIYCRHKNAEVGPSPTGWVDGSTAALAEALAHDASMQSPGKGPV